VSASGRRLLSAAPREPDPRSAKVETTSRERLRSTRLPVSAGREASVKSPQRHDRDESRLGALLYEVNRCRAQVRSGRQTALTTRDDQSQRCARLADAMEAYAAAAAESGVPLPYRYRDEMRLYRAMAQSSNRTSSPPSAS
jgi:hypothetical protein